MNYKERLNCNEYIPACVINELERLNNEIERLKRDKVTRTPIVPDSTEIYDIPSQTNRDDSYNRDVGECPLGLPPATG
jgi:hypothetical protein